MFERIFSIGKVKQSGKDSIMVNVLELLSLSCQHPPKPPPRISYVLWNTKSTKYIINSSVIGEKKKK